MSEDPIFEQARKKFAQEENAIVDAVESGEMGFVELLKRSIKWGWRVVTYARRLREMKVIPGSKE